MFRCLRHNVELGIDTTRFTAVLWKLSQRRCKMKASTRVLKVMRDMWYFGTARHDCPRGEGCQRTSLHHTNEQHSPLLGQRWTNFRALSVSSDRRRLSCAFLVQSFVLTSASWPSPRFACTPCNSASNTFELLVTSASLMNLFQQRPQAAWVHPSAKGSRQTRLSQICRARNCSQKSRRHGQSRKIRVHSAA